MGSSRNSPSKAERRLDRKQRREAANRQDHRDKEKAREKEIKEENKDKPKKQTAWKRRDKNGNIVLWNAIKISKTSGYVLGGMAAIIILFAISPKVGLDLSSRIEICLFCDTCVREHNCKQ